MIEIEILHDEYFDLIKKKNNLIENIKTTKYPLKLNKELEKLNHIISFDEYIVEGSFSVLEIMNETDIINKTILYNKYIEKFYPKLKYQHSKIIHDDKCKYCDGDNFNIDYKNCQQICLDCGNYDEYTIYRHTWDVEQLHSYNKTSYDKINTMIEWMDLFTGRDTKDIDNKLIETIKERLSRMKNEDISVDIINKVLKEMKLNKKYKYSYYICAKITGRYPTITREKEKIIYEYFSLIQDSFNRLKQKNIIKRKNIWMYHYCVYKICELIDEKHIMSFIQKPLICNEKNLYKYDEGWKKIMEDLKLPFYRSI